MLSPWKFLPDDNRNPSDDGGVKSRIAYRIQFLSLPPPPSPSPPTTSCAGWLSNASSKEEGEGAGKMNLRV